MMVQLNIKLDSLKWNGPSRLSISGYSFITAYFMNGKFIGNRKNFGLILRYKISSDIEFDNAQLRFIKFNLNSE